MSWLKPYLRTWYQVYPESVPPMRQLAHYVKPLTKAHPPERIATELAGYLRKTEARYINLAKFAATFGAWGERQETVKSRPAQYRTVDECDRDAGIPAGAKGLVK
jgi:hypothetical protein